MKRLNTILTYTAIFISFCAFFVSIYQTQVLKKQTEIMQEQQQAAVWPRLFIARSTSSNIYQYQLKNDGVGPAIIKYVEISIDGKAYKTWDDIISSISGQKGNSLSRSMINNRVIRSCENVIMFSINDVELIKKIYKQKSKITIDIYYTSVYGKCWRLKQESGQPFAVPEIVDDYPRTKDSEFMN
ncbi:hypothetical protein [Ancylomarina sp. 16SWW S1-10-2]|uniref:hypothetical protein n=1 Tax=Ancylomarina sp. 16SWW S1-10-2 TaxID=2499681 RepID=UPI0012AE5FF4|nr:hypothetical protein [Ancylomarina sp. 16SWW S1-10-2]MRT93491.1 hypothetical protein [Ancylomarina sp. 16SWW S1-10-2]